MTVTGHVSDVRPAYWDASVFVAPLQIARGVQNKVLDAAAAGLAPARDLDTSKSFGMFSCSKASNEMNYLAGKFTRQVMGSNNVDSCNRT